MADASSYLITQITNHLLRTASWTKPSGVYVALLTTMPSNNTGSGLVEVTGGSYARVQIGPGDTAWNASGKNINSAAYPAPTANWGNVKGFALYDAATTGNLLLYKTLATAKDVNNGDPAPTWDAQQLTITIY